MEKSERIKKVGNLGLDMKALLDEKDQAIEGLFFGNILLQCVGKENLNTINVETMNNVLERMRDRILIFVGSASNEKLKLLFEKFIEINRIQKELGQHVLESVLPMERVVEITNSLNMTIDEGQRKKTKERIDRILEELEVMLGRTAAFLIDTPSYPEQPNELKKAI